jgi:hypothetical protein
LVEVVAALHAFLSHPWSNFEKLPSRLFHQTFEGCVFL